MPPIEMKKITHIFQHLTSQLVTCEVGCWFKRSSPGLQWKHPVCRFFGWRDRIEGGGAVLGVRTDSQTKRPPNATRSEDIQTDLRIMKKHPDRGMTGYVPVQAMYIQTDLCIPTYQNRILFQCKVRGTNKRKRMVKSASDSAIRVLSVQREVWV